MSGTYEEMEVFDDEFYVELSPNNEKSSRKKCQIFIKKQDRCHACMVASVSNLFFNNIMFNL